MPKVSEVYEHLKYSPCNCERVACNHPAGGCKTPAGKRKAMYLGRLCDECAELMPKEYML